MCRDISRGTKYTVAKAKQVKARQRAFTEELQSARTSFSAKAPIGMFKFGGLFTILSIVLSEQD